MNVEMYQLNKDTMNENLASFVLSILNNESKSSEEFSVNVATFVASFIYQLNNPSDSIALCEKIIERLRRQVQ
jgi:hypothetical protein